MDLEKTDGSRKLVVPINAHARITRPDQNGGAAMVRRPFSYHDGFDADGVPDAGLLFICWQADPLRGFVPVQRKLDRGDALSPFIRHEAERPVPSCPGRGRPREGTWDSGCWKGETGDASPPGEGRGETRGPGVPRAH
ncbi:hypothetical protein SVIOM342S_06351 [Streptomyces violaceorubidus]